MNIEEVTLHGMNLVEASAGTGKTHTLSSLYVRLVLEQGMAPESILVMTYTQAATAELKTRIRQRLIDARGVFQGGESGDSLLSALDLKLTDKTRAVRQLDLALACFDRAAIFTIHGFCQRVLTEYAFESGQAFHTELVPDQAVRLQQIADDFWRREMERLPPLFLEALQERIATPDQLLFRLKPALGKPYLEVRTADWPDGLEELEAKALRQQLELRNCWNEQRDEIQALLSDKQVLKGSVYRAVWVVGWCAKMDQWLNGNPYQAPFDKAERFTPALIEGAVKAGKSAPRHPFFNAFDAYLPIAENCAQAFQRAVVAWHGKLYAYLLEELPRRQAEAGEWSYDDLLLQLQQALRNDSSDQLVLLLRKCYKAALVDEFQDTDPIQYEILQKIYQGSGQPVFLVGDPKQAIYSFRGADIFTYLAARDKTGAKWHSLSTNWRSTAQMVQAINALFSLSPNPFYDRRIAFQPSAPAERQMEALTQGRKRGPALHIWRLPVESQLSSEELRQEVAETTAIEIANLLAPDSAKPVKVGERDLRASDIAILVRTHSQAARLALALHGKGISSVRSSQQSVFCSPEAEALERVLIALMEPHRESLMRGALATMLFGWDGAGIDRLNHDERAQSEISRRFYRYHQTWRNKGFIAMFRGVMTELGIENRLLDYQDGERRLTNLYHLVELLQQQDNGQRPGMDGLVNWFRQQRYFDSQDEERLLRLESDGDLVRIDTLHHSKGLEYGIVFCPYLWDEPGVQSSDAPFLFHDPLANDAAAVELGSEAFAQNLIYRQQEILAENLRLAYVALTRSRYRCYLPWGLNRQSRRSALCWLLHSGGPPRPPEGYTEWQDVAQALQPQQDEQRLEALQTAARGSVVITSMPQYDTEPQLPLVLPPELKPARPAPSTIPKHLQVTSFSSLVAGQSEDLPDHDGLAVVASHPPEPEERFDVHGFPRGSGPGSCLHAILEELDFTQPEIPTLESLVSEKLLLYGIESRWRPVVVNWMLTLLETPLTSDGLVLGGVTSQQRLNEMAFHFPVHAFNPKQIGRLSEQYRFTDTRGLLDGLAGLNSISVDGYIKGYIDLIFEQRGRYYLADYKSNWLGKDCSAYHKQALYQAMGAHHYSLQYLLYTLALHRYLRLRIADYDYDRHFGGVFYLFLRGMAPDSVERLGIVEERPPAEFIQALDRSIGGLL
jgi:exodeoxyribonuclease V beta subunit